MSAQPITQYDEQRCEVYYPGDYSPDGQLEMTDWSCLACQENEADRPLYHNKAGFVCLECGERYANDGELARAHTARFIELYERIGELEGDKAHAEMQLLIVEAKLSGNKRVAA